MRISNYTFNVSYLRTKIITTTIIIPISSNTPTTATTAPATAPVVEMLSMLGAATRVAFTTGSRKNQNNRNQSSIVTYKFPVTMTKVKAKFQWWLATGTTAIYIPTCLIMSLFV